MTLSHTTAWLCCAVVTGLLGACSPQAGPDWFPLRPGDETRYTVQYNDEADRTDETWTLRTREPVTWRGQSHAVRHHSQGVAYLFQTDAHGVRRVAHQTDIDREPQPDESPMWVLKAPYQTGTEWTTSTVPYLLMRKNEYPRDLRYTHKTTMTWRIVSDKESLTLASGKTLQPCLHVVGEAFLNLYTDPVNGFTDVPLTSHEWYCQGHGLMKFTREEKVPAGFLTGGRLSAQRAP
jgi:hypothetical protein